MRAPGTLARRLLQSWCTSRLVARVVDPVIADLQEEHASAIRQGRRWRARRIHTAGLIALLKALLVEAALGGVRSAFLDRESEGRRLAIASTVFALAASAMIVFETAPFMRWAATEDPRSFGLAFALLFPSSLPIALPFGLTLGLVSWLGARRSPSRPIAALALVASVTSFVLLAWVVPESNQSFRVAVAGPGVVRGLNELALSDLMQRAAEERVSGGNQTATYALHRRLALSVAPFVLCAFAMVLPGVAQRRSRRWLLAGLGLSVYCALLNIPAGAAPIAAAWCSNLAVTSITAVMLPLRRPEVRS